MIMYPKPKHQRTCRKRKYATNIPQKVKEIVFDRDNGKCIICGKNGIPNAHYIKRSQGGLGIEQNVVTLCQNCHNEEDFGQDTNLYESEIKEYLKGKYEDWNEEDLYYRKGVNRYD